MKKTTKNQSSRGNNRRELFDGIESYDNSEIALDRQDETMKMKIDLNKGLDEALAKLDSMRELVVDMNDDLQDQEKQLNQAEHDVELNLEKVVKVKKTIEKDESGGWFTSWLNKFFE